MRALTFQGVESVAFDSIPDPRIELQGDAIVRVRLSGICGSDLHVYHGRETGLDLGTVLGHEFVGEIIDVGSGVQSLRRGDLVVCPFTTNCGECRNCRRGLTSRCSCGELFGWRQNGEGLHGAQAELVRVPLADSTAVRVPAGIAPEQALLAADVLATGYFCAEHGGVSADTTVVILGCGPVGLMAILAARHLGAKHVLAVDRVSERLSLAESFGAEPVDLEGQDLVRVVGGATGGEGADVILEAVGSAQASRLAIELLRPGGTISAVGVHTETDFAFTPGEAYDKNLTYRIGRCPARRYLDIVLPLVASLELDPSIIISHYLPLGDGVRGYQIFAEKLESCTKVVLIP